MVSKRKGDDSVAKNKKGSKSIVKMKTKGSVMDEFPHGIDSIKTQKQLKIWDLYYDDDEMNFGGKIKFWCDMDVPGIICSKLNTEHIGLLKKTVFGQFFEVEKRRMFSQLIHQGLVREIHQTDDHEIWFLFGQERARFSLAEFCLISGLMGSGNIDISDYESVENTFMSKYFPEEAVTRSLIRKKFNDADFENDEEAVRLSLIFLVFNFILATVEENIVDDGLLRFLSCGDINGFPWGKIAFDMLNKSLQNALKGNVKKVDRGVFEYNFYRQHCSRFYKLKGLVYVFQVFLYETILDIKQRGFCIDDQQSAVRMFKWIELGNLPSSKKLRDNIFDTGKMKVQLVVPTKEEINRLGLNCFNFPEIINNNSAQHEEKKNGDYPPFDTSKLKDLIDASVKPLNTEMRKMRKEVRQLRTEVRANLNEFQTSINNIIDAALKKVLSSVDVAERETKQQQEKDFFDGDNEATNNEEGDVSMRDTNEGARDDKVAFEKDKAEIKTNTTGMEVVLYTPEKARKIPEVQEEESLDIILSTQEIIQIDEVVRSLSKMRRRPARKVKKSRALKSPYTANLRSGAVPLKVAVNTKPIGYMSAFPTICMQMPSNSDNATFDQWFAVGLNKRKRYDKFPGMSNVITPPFTFGGVEIESKMWFYRLYTPGQFMDNKHIDICFYYLRKLAKYCNEIPIRVTTTDCWFHMKMTILFKSFNDHDRDESILTSDDNIVEYIQGTKLRASTRWVEVDHVLFPIHMTGPDHWFMLAFDVARRRLVAYNSYHNDGTQMKELISDVCEPYIYILPIILSNCGFWKARKDIDLTSDGYMGVGERDNIELEIAKGLPEQVESDCGMFTIGFAEHYIHHNIHQIPQPFPTPQYRKKLSVNLYLYAKQKFDGEYESEAE